MGRPLAWVVPVVALCLVSGCDQYKATRPAPAVAERAPGAPDATAPQHAVTAALDRQASARKLIRTGQLSLEVGDYSAAVAKAEALVESLGGYLADSQTSRGARDRRYGTLTARVPAEQFKAAMGGLKALGKVLSENTATQDVTKAYTDLETRLRVKRETSERLREILRGKTARLSDVLEVERELARVTEEIEGLEGERRFYDQQIAMSSIALSLAEPEAVVSAGAFDPIVKALKGSLEILSISVAALIAVVVFVAPWALVLWLVWRVIARLRARRRARAKATA
jgi:hypothetical protein